VQLIGDTGSLTQESILSSLCQQSACSTSARPVRPVAPKTSTVTLLTPVTELVAYQTSRGELVRANSEVIK
jgi:hypothetical protein